MAKANQNVRTPVPSAPKTPTKQQVMDAICQRYETIRVAEAEIRALRAAFTKALSEPESPTNGIVKPIVAK